MTDVVLESILTCPSCGVSTPCIMPTNACQFFFPVWALQYATQAQAGRLLCILLIWVDEMPAYSERQFVLLDHESW